MCQLFNNIKCMRISRGLITPKRLFILPFHILNSIHQRESNPGVVSISICTLTTDQKWPGRLVTLQHLVLFRDTLIYFSYYRIKNKLTSQRNRTFSEQHHCSFTTPCALALVKIHLYGWIRTNGLCLFTLLRCHLPS